MTRFLKQGEYEAQAASVSVADGVVSVTDGAAASGPPQVSYQSIGEDIGALVDQKNKQYGSSFSRAGQIMRVLYPNGIALQQMDDALAVVRVIDKLFRIAQRGVDGKDLGGESPWRDVTGYGILGAARDERKQNG